MTLQVLKKNLNADELLNKLTKFKLEPLHEWVLIRKIARGEVRTDGGVTLAAQDRSQKGVVVAVGDKTTVQIGDMVIFTGFPMGLADIEEVTGEKDLFLVRDEEIYSRIVPCT